LPLNHSAVGSLNAVELSVCVHSHPHISVWVLRVTCVDCQRTCCAAGSTDRLSPSVTLVILPEELSWVATVDDIVAVEILRRFDATVVVAVGAVAIVDLGN
jgi:hypothetical protein